MFQVLLVPKYPAYALEGQILFWLTAKLKQNEWSIAFYSLLLGKVSKKFVLVFG